MATWSELNINLKGRNNGKFKTLCPKCSHTRRKKSDPCLYVDIDSGVYKCYNCDFKGSVNGREKREHKKVEYKQPEFKNITEASKKTVEFFGMRGIKQETVLHFKVKNSNQYMPQASENRNCIMWQYFLNGEAINAKYRDGHKNFKMESGARKTLYNVDAVKDSEEILFCEGEIDCMSWHQAGYNFSVSVPNGANKSSNNLDYLNDIWDSHLANKKKVYIAVDNDEAGEGLKQDLIRTFGKDICYIVTYPKFKIGEKEVDGEKEDVLSNDANDILKWESPEKLMELLQNAEGFDLEGVFTVKSIEDELWEQFRDPSKQNKGTTTYIPELDPHWTWRKGDNNVLHGPGNHGKSNLACNLLVLKSMNEGDRWAIFSPEQFPPVDFFNDLIHTYIGKSTDPDFKHLQMSEKEYQKGLDFVNEHFIYVYPEFQTYEDIIGKFKALIIRQGITGVVIDPFNKLHKSVEEVKMRDDQRINAFNNEYKKFIAVHDMYSMIITHSVRIKSHESSKEILEPNMYQNIEGGEMWSKNADNILCYYRPYFLKDKADPLAVITSQKIKNHKRIGSPGEIEVTFSKETNRFYNMKGKTPFDENDTLQKTIQLELMPENLSNLRPISSVEEDEEDPFWD